MRKNTGSAAILLGASEPALRRRGSGGTLRADRAASGRRRFLSGGEDAASHGEAIESGGVDSFSPNVASVAGASRRAAAGAGGVGAASGRRAAAGTGGEDAASRGDAIAADGICFSYGDEPILSRVSLTVGRGDFVGIIGANGSGKSTLLRILLGELALAPASGTVRLFGQELRNFRDWPRIGFLPQYGVSAGDGFPATAEEVVTANLFSQIGFMRFTRKKHRDKARAALSLVGMEAYGGRLIGKLSGGQRQRVMLARVLVGDPDMLLLDEPTTGVDEQTVSALLALLTRLNRERGLTVVMVTHDVARISKYVSKILCLEEGSIVELDKAQIERELEHKHKHPARA